MQLVQPHPYRNGDRQHGLQIGVDARHGGLYRFEGIVEHQVGDISRNRQHEKRRKQGVTGNGREIGVNDRADT